MLMKEVSKCILFNVFYTSFVNTGGAQTDIFVLIGYKFQAKNAVLIDFH